MKTPIKVTVTGAAGQIGYALLFKIASGDMLGLDQPIILHVLEIPHNRTQQNLQGICMELEDCAFPLLYDIKRFDQAKEAFRDTDIAILVGSMPRKPGMERRDLLNLNARIFIEQGRALNEVAKPHVKVLVVGNPANTNAYIAQQSAPDLPPENFTCMLRLDHNRALNFLSKSLHIPLQEIHQLCVWGNHSPSMYPDMNHALYQEKPIRHLVPHSTWEKDIFIPTIAQRGAEIMEIRGHSSAGSAANAIIDHMRDWVLGSNGRWVSMGIPSPDLYGVPKNIQFGMPVICENGHYKPVSTLDIHVSKNAYLQNSLNELIQEKTAIESLLRK